MAALTVFDLPAETILHVLRYVSVQDILRVRKTCHDLNAITYSRSVWSDALLAHALEPNIPLTGLRGRDISSLNAFDLEQLVHKTIYLHRNWTSLAPKPTRILNLQPRPDHADLGKVSAVHFLPGRGNRWLLYIGFYAQPGDSTMHSTLNCWDLHANPPIRRAAVDFAPIRMSWSLLLVNSDPTHPVAFVVSRGSIVRSPESENHEYLAYGMNETDDTPHEPFTVLAQHTSSSHPRALHGSMLFFETHHENLELPLTAQVRDVLTGNTVFLLRVESNMVDPIGMDDRVKSFLRVVVCDRYILMFRTRRILIYFVPRDPYPSRGAVLLESIGVYQWQWRIDSIEYSLPKKAHGLPKTTSSSRPLPPITLLVRFDSYYPWPVNLLHHFVLFPNPIFGPSVSQLSASNLPYTLQPYSITTVASPMRMFTPSDLVLGPYGTSIWIDAQTDPDPTQAGDHGQRLAARTLADGHGAPVPAAETQTRVLQVDETENVWGRLALDEEEGRIAIGGVDGRVTLFDYGILEGM